MNKNLSNFLGFTVIITTLIFSGCQNQENEASQPADNGNRKSPIAIASINHASTYIKVVYGQPYRRGREIFGGLVPYGEVWRTGANEATEITITNTILMGEEAVSAGTYAMFTIPQPDSITVILNHELGQWGAFEYNADRDYKRMKFPVKKLDTPVEAFTIQFAEPNQSLTTMSMKWADVQVDIPIRFYGE